MRKTLSAVLAAAALFGGAAISNGVANASQYEVYTPFSYEIKTDTCRGNGQYGEARYHDAENHIYFQQCDIRFADGQVANYSIVDGFDDVESVTIPASVGGKDVLQVGWLGGGSLVQLNNIKYLTINANRGIAGTTSKQYMTVTPESLSNHHFNKITASGIIYSDGALQVLDADDKSEMLHGEPVIR